MRAGKEGWWCRGVVCTVGIHIIGGLHWRVACCSRIYVISVFTCDLLHLFHSEGGSSRRETCDGGTQGSVALESPFVGGATRAGPWCVFIEWRRLVRVAAAQAAELRVCQAGPTAGFVHAIKMGE